MLRYDQANVGEDQAPAITLPYAEPINPPTGYGTPGYVPGTTYILPGSAYGVYAPIAKGRFGDVKQSNITQESYVAEELQGCECSEGERSMFASGMGAEEYGPPAPTTIQQVVQTVRDIATSEVAIPSAFSTQTIIYALGGAALAYLAYNYWYGRAIT